MLGAGTFHGDGRGPSYLLVSLIQTGGRPVLHVHAAIVVESNMEIEHEPCFAELEEEGVFVLRAVWEGSGEDSELVIDEVRPLNDLERECIEANNAIEAAVLAWLEGEWADVECTCGHPGREHARHTPEVGFGACPEGT